MFNDFLVHSGVRRVVLALNLMLGSGLLIGAPTAQGSALTLTVTPLPCPAGHLIVGELARVTPGSPDNVRSAASKSADIVTQIAQSAEALITGQPTCADGYLWWPVHTLNGFDGWVAEGDQQTAFIMPTTGAIQTYHLSANSTTPLQVAYNNVQITYLPALAAVLGTTLSVTTVSAYNADPTLDPNELNPVYDRWGFGVRTVDNLYDWPTLAIYPVTKVEVLDATNKNAIDAVIGFLKTKPDPTILDHIPVYPLAMAGQVVHAQHRIVNFNGGIGFRFVAAYASDVSPITNDRGLRYQFIGLTNDGRSFLSFAVPITTAALNGNDAAFPDLNAPDIATLYARYVSDTAIKLNKAATTDFSIDLEQLDTLMASITIR